MNFRTIMFSALLALLALAGITAQAQSQDIRVGEARVSVVQRGPDTQPELWLESYGVSGEDIVFSWTENGESRTEVVRPDEIERLRLSGDDRLISIRFSSPSGLGSFVIEREDDFHLRLPLMSGN